MSRNTIKSGFTLIEILIVIGIFGLIASLGFAIDLSFLRRDTMRAEQKIIVSALEKARSRSMSNVFESAHGFCYDGVSKNYIIFRNGVCAVSATSEIILANVSIAGNPYSTFPFLPIIFTQLSGTTTDATIIIGDGVKSSTITINHEGTINW